MTTNKNSKKFILGTLIGGLIGSAAALLMAPRSGEKTQKLILEKGEGWRQEAEKRMDEGRYYMEDKVIEARNSIAEWLSAGSSLLDEKSEEIMVGNGKQASKKKQASSA